MRAFFTPATTLPTRFIQGTIREVEELFGSNLPELPEGQSTTGQPESLVVDLHSGLKKAAAELIEYFYRTLTAKQPAEMPRVGFLDRPANDPYSRYAYLLGQILTNIIENERRLGLLNLFWLAHSTEVAEVIAAFFGQPAVKVHVKYRLHPLLSGMYRNVHNLVWMQFKSQKAQRLKYNMGADFNGSLIDCIIDDQLPLTEGGIARVNLTHVLVEDNKRFRITFTTYKEIFGIVRQRLRDGIQRREPALLEMLRRTFPGMPPQEYDEERGATKLLANTRILTHLLLDYASVGARMTDSRVLRDEVGGRRTWSDLLGDYLDLMQALKRSEVVDILRQSVNTIPPGLDELQLRELFTEGRLYRFQESTEVLNTARKVTILFADLRGFTLASEGGVSERELTSHLYEVFDPLASFAEQYQGKIDKFTGDGVMMTFGAVRSTREDELNALRTALALQELMEGLRRAGRTRFHMGISIHTGRAQVAHFIVDDRTMDSTVIGRNVNIAGRLSSSGEARPAGPGTTPGPPAAPQPGGKGQEPPRDVWVDQSGVLYNSGTAVSQDTVDELRKAVSLAAPDGAHGMGYRFFDEKLQKNILLEYVGDAKFKGLGRSIPIYSLRPA